MTEFKIDDEYVLIKDSESSHWNTYQFGNLLPKSTPHLYKFYSLNLNSIDSLFRNYFYLANPKDFNDPFDCNVNLVEDIGDLSKMKTVQRNNYGNIGISSFTEVIDNHLMWAHYTNNYNGWALGFEGDKIQMKEDKGHLEKYTLTRVIYPEKLIKIKKDYGFAEHYVMTTKLKHWSYEKEWRLVTQLLKDDRELLYFPDCVNALYIGHKIFDNSINIYKLIMEIHTLRFPNIPIFVVYPHPTELKLEFERVFN